MGIGMGMGMRAKHQVQQSNEPMSSDRGKCMPACQMEAPWRKMEMPESAKERWGVEVGCEYTTVEVAKRNKTTTAKATTAATKNMTLATINNNNNNNNSGSSGRIAFSLSLSIAQQLHLPDSEMRQPPDVVLLS
ncbi:hypothetical protein AWZ03_007787 [Drosophila navojoa]|uniref:Uncharacterized protein n=1 Tax=Drosophila navojoa TaxID=7232 RepID=A0A484BBZ3_DRONA|nr:hypothetical protein AWZ03_007787 [Drosophila navojoa]